MAVLTLPQIPTLEPVKTALAAAVTTYLQQALDDVTALFPAETWSLSTPKRIILSTITRWQLVTAWPTLSIDGFNLRMRQAAEMKGAGIWLGRIELLYFAQNSNIGTLAQMLDRYAAALWAVVTVANDRLELEGASVQPETIQIEASDPTGTSSTSRAVLVAFDVQFST